MNDNFKDALILCRLKRQLKSMLKGGMLKGGHANRLKRSLNSKPRGQFKRFLGIKKQFLASGRTPEQWKLFCNGVCTSFGATKLFPDA